MEENNLTEKLQVNENIKDSIYNENQNSNLISKEEYGYIKTDIQTLNTMGFNQKMINKVYMILKPESIERAIDIMTPINGIYYHDFNENKTKNPDLCFICNKPKHLHFKYNELSLKIEDEIPKEENEEKIEETLIKKNKMCNICFDELNEKEENENKLKCKHICCTQCWENYFKTLITEAKVEKIKCINHECKEIIPENFILKFIKNDEMLSKKYEKFKSRARILNDKNKKLCPEPDCESYLEKKNDEIFVKCKNGHKYCYECLNKWHLNSTCKQIKESLERKGNKILKRCPRCSIYTEKKEGCNNITCTNCHYKWCWLCEKECNYNHYYQRECYGLQFTKDDSLTKAKDINLNIINNDYIDYRESFCSSCHCWDINETLENIEEDIALESESSKFFSCDCILTIFYYFFLGFFINSHFIMRTITEIDYEEAHKVNENKIYTTICILTSFCLSICFQIFYIALFSPFSIFLLCKLNCLLFFSFCPICLRELIGNNG